MFGHDSSLKGIGRKSLLARADFSDLLDGDWTRLEYWTTSGWSQAGRPYKAAVMQPLAVPSWETTLRWSAELGRWYLKPHRESDSLHTYLYNHPLIWTEIYHTIR